MADETVVATVKLRGDIADLTAKLSSATGAVDGETKRMAIAIQKSFLKAEASSKALEKSILATAAASKSQAEATDRLIDLAAQHGSAEDRLNRSLEKTRAEIWSLAAASGDAEQAQRALVAAETEHAASLARLRNQQGAVTTSVNTTSGSYGNLINQLADISKGLATGQSPLTIMAQQGEHVAFALEQAGGATEVLRKGVIAIKTADAGAIFLSIASGIKGVGVALLPIAPSIAVVTAAAAALGYAWHQASKELDAANLKMEESARIAAEAQEAYENLSKVQMSTTDKWLVATGQATDKDLELRDSVASITEVYGPRIKAEQEAIKAAKAAAAAGYEQMTQQNAQGDAIQEGAKAWRENTAAVEAAEKRLAGLTQEQGVYLQRAAIGILTTDDDTNGRKKNAKAIKEQTDQMSFFSMALIQYEEQQRVTAEIEARRAYATAAAITFVGKAWDEARTKAAKAGAAMREESIKAQSALEARGEAERQQIVSSLATQHEAVVSIAASVGDVAGTISSILTDQAMATDAALSVTTGKIDDIRVLMDGLSTATVNAADLSGRALVEAYKSGEVAAVDLSDTQRKAIAATLAADEARLQRTARAQSELLEEQKRASIAAFNVQKGANIASAALNAPAAILAAAAINPALGVAAAILAASQVVAIATAKPPSFRRGGSALPDERQVVASVEDGELLQVTSRQGAAKARSDANNAGMSAPMGGMGTSIVLNGRDIGRIIETGMQSARGRRAVTQAPARGRAPRKGT